MSLLISGARVIDPQRGFDAQADIAIDASGMIVAVGAPPDGFKPERTIDASGLVACPGLTDLSVRLREPGHEHEGMLFSELSAAVAGGVTSLVCPPDTDPVLDEPGLVEMLRLRAAKLALASVHPLGALTRGLQGAVLTEMDQLFDAGCVGFSQAEVAIADTQVLLRTLQYAATYGHTVWLRPHDAFLGQGGVAASGALATRLGLSGVPASAETVALFTIFELVRATGCRVHLCRLSTAKGVEMLRAAKAEGLPVTADVSVHNLLLTEVDIGYFDSNFRLLPVLRTQRDRSALAQGLADGTIDALTSDHTPVERDAKLLPFAESAPGASSIELLLSLALQWGAAHKLALPQVLSCLTHQASAIASIAVKSIQAATSADLILFNTSVPWLVNSGNLVSQGKNTPFDGYELAGRVQATIIGARVVFERFERV